MTAFYQLYPLWRALFMLGMHLDTCLLLYIGIRFVQQRRPVWMRILAVLLAVASFVTQRFMMGETLAEAKGYPRRGIPALWLILPFLLLALVMTLLLLSIRRWGRNHITSASVKESFDALPEGVCYYWEGGLPKLVNSRMQELSLEIAGGNLRDADGFARTIRSGQLPEGILRIPREDGVLLRLKDGRTFSFRRAMRKLEKHDIHELIAVDVTEEYRIYEALDDKREKAGEYNRRLKELNRSITVMSMEKEMLQTKIRIHDEFGRALLMAKKYLLSPSATDREEMLRLWKRTTMLIGREEPEGWQLHLAAEEEEENAGETAGKAREEEERFLEKLVSRAAVLGVRLDLSGPLPVSEEAREILEDAVDTHVTNTVRHAGGHLIEVKCAREDGRFTAAMTNDGRAPSGEIREAGGLKNLRREIEDAGGHMTVAGSPGFLLEFGIPDDPPNGMLSGITDGASGGSPAGKEEK